MRQEPDLSTQKDPAKGFFTRFEISPKIAIPWGLALIILGLLPILALLGIIKVRANSFHAPIWLVVPLTGCFPIGGAFLLFHGLANIFDSASRFSILLTWLGNFFVSLLAISFFGGMTVFLNWQLFAPTPGDMQIEVMGIQIYGRLAAILDNALVAFAALLFDTLALVFIWQAVKRAFSSGKASQSGPQH